MSLNGDEMKVTVTRSLQHPQHPGGVTHTLTGPTAMGVNVPSLGSAADDTLKGSRIAL